MMQAALYNPEVMTPARLITRYIVFTFAWFSPIDRTLTLCIGSAS